MFRNVVRCISLVRVEKVQEELLAYAGSSFFCVYAATFMNPAACLLRPACAYEGRSVSAITPWHVPPSTPPLSVAPPTPPSRSRFKIS